MHLTPPGEHVFSGGSNDNQELLKAWAGTSLAFAIAMVGGQILDMDVLTGSFLVFLPISALTCGLGFVLHELAHRILARSYGAEAHFVADNAWLFMSVLVSFAGWFLAAPGAVWHRGTTTKQQGGIIALGGPVTNLVLAMIFLLLHVGVGAQDFGGLASIHGTYVINVWGVGYTINAWLGLFNMLPFGPIDGKKVLDWNPVVFGITIGVAVIMAFVIPGPPVVIF